MARKTPNPHTLLADMYIQGAILSIDCPFVSWFVIKEDVTLLGKFTLKDKVWTQAYTFIFRYTDLNTISVWLNSPAVPGNPDAHIDNDGLLCLFFPSDFSNRKLLLIARDIVPKCRAWADNYEYYLIPPHKWLGNERPHGEALEMEFYHLLKTGKTGLFK